MLLLKKEEGKQTFLKDRRDDRKGVVQLNKYETDPYFLLIFQVIRQFVWLFQCFVRVANPFVNLLLHLCYITLRIKTKTISRSVFSSQILKNAEINIVLHCKFWRKYGSASHLFSCKGDWDLMKGQIFWCRW